MLMTESDYGTKLLNPAEYCIASSVKAADEGFVCIYILLYDFYNLNALHSLKKTFHFPVNSNLRDLRLLGHVFNIYCT